jgi:hypothetical protein
MTSVTKPVRRKTATLYRGRALVVTVHPRHIEIREERRWDSVSVDIASVYEFALKLRWRKLEAEKHQRKTKGAAK